MSANVYDTVVNTYTRNYVRSAIPGEPLVMLPVRLKPSGTYPMGSVLSEADATQGLYGLHGTANYGVGRAVLPIACTTDASGNITAGTQPANRTVTTLTVEAIFGGYIKAEDVPSLTETQAHELGSLTYGVVDNGILHIGDGHPVVVDT